LIDEMTTMMLANHPNEHGAEVRFRLRAEQEKRRGLALLKKAAS
jgi:hypothetical protein